MNNTAVIVLVAVVAVVLAVVTFLIVRRQRYIRALRSRGWTFESTPPLSSVLDHHAPPFGLGFVRDADEGIAGQTRSGVPFRVFKYSYAEGGPKFDERLASLSLPLALPDLFLSVGPPRSGIRYGPVVVDPGLEIRAADVNYARTLLSDPVRAALAGFGQAGHRVDLSIDGSALVAVGAPKDPDELEAYLDLLAPVAQAIDPAALAAYAQSPVAPSFSFYGRPDWVLVGTDNDLIRRYGLTTTGFAHTTEKVVRGDNAGLPIDACLHRWKTQRTEVSTDSEGRTQTRTVTEAHSEVLAAITLPFALPLLSIGGGWGGKKVRFESEEFNDRFTVRTNVPKLAYDIIHPRTMEFLMATNPPSFRIERHLMRFTVATHDSQLIGVCADFAHNFLGQVPSFVWEDLRVTPPPFRMSRAL